jgi:hypothetical protein
MFENLLQRSNKAMFSVHQHIQDHFDSSSSSDDSTTGKDSCLADFALSIVMGTNHFNHLLRLF